MLWLFIFDSGCFSLRIFEFSEPQAKHLLWALLFLRPSSFSQEDNYSTASSSIAETGCVETCVEFSVADDGTINTIGSVSSITG
jgi:hypothetical protein